MIATVSAIERMLRHKREIKFFHAEIEIVAIEREDNPNTGIILDPPQVSPTRKSIAAAVLKTSLLASLVSARTTWRTEN